MSEKRTIKNALISVFHKDGLAPIAQQLNELGVSIYSTGGTQSFIEEQGINVNRVEDLTTYPSILGGRVKTLHPNVFGGILSRRELESDKEQLEQYGIPEFDLVIVATGANVREKVVTQLLEGFTVGYLVLEKVLFQDIESYDKIALLLEKTNTPTWVNHSRRMLDHFQQIKKIIGESKEQMTFHVVGSNWGLACNAVHCIDLCYFLSDSALGKVDMDWIDPSVHKSKRLNCIEFTGTVKGRMKDDSSFMITSLDGEFSDDTIFVSTNSNRWIIQEGAQKIIHLSESNNFNEEINTFTTEFQSTLTTRLVNDIFEFGTCDLPSYNEACKSHVPFIEASLKKYTEITGIKTNICPIT